METHQTEDAQNRWQEFVEAATSLAASWEYFSLSNPKIAARVKADPERRVADPLAILDDPSGLVGEVRGFFDTLDNSQLMDRLDDLTHPSRFVALRAVDPLVTTSQPELGKLRLGVKLCVARMRVMAIDERPEQVRRSVEHALAMAAGAQGRGLIVGYLSANASWAAVEREVREQILDGRMPGPTCGAVLSVLAERTPPDARTALGGERFYAMESIDQFFDKVREEQAAANAGGGKAGQEAPSLAGIAPRDEQIKQANRFFDGVDRMLGPDEKQHASGEADVKAVLALGEQKDPTYKPLVMVLPPVENTARAARTFALHHAGTTAMLALEVFRSRTGHYPEKLEELVPDDLAAAPLDPFAAGKPLRYKRLEADGTRPGAAYLLYSVGTDGEDNAGVPHPTSRASALGPAAGARGYDYIINAK